MDKSVEKYLKKIYYNPEHYASYGSINTLYRASKVHFPNIKRKHIVRAEIRTPLN